ncbi:hypothetical protein Vretimale_5038 [Volvox reticuliferus]|uniref:Uncharacterized protein n=1 Tax=Volvox reticuliferus TaxID=1737510 RepID=A0A8J4DCX0_9CHLO|nr:hypothetical protein Vretifemale_3935 [Volvox reticuliferus]GIM00129.1 hypothetical protein Vretimale_5038 [Volvox reticuliferus]
MGMQGGYLQGGYLQVTLHYAMDIKDCDWFGKQDPYVKIKLGAREATSSICRNGGRRPIWNEVFNFELTTETTLDLTIMDEDKLMRDDLIGTCSISLATIRQQGHEVVNAPVTDGKEKYKHQGFIQLTLNFVPSAAASAASRFQHTSSPRSEQQPSGVYQLAPVGPTMSHPYPAFYANNGCGRGYNG